MKIILREDVKGLGKKDELVNAKDGYAKNYLFPRGLAVKANAVNVNEIDIKNNAKKARKEKEVKTAKDLAEKIGNIELIIKAKAGEGERLFGSITSKDIVDKLKEQYSIKVDKKKVVLNESIKSVGKREIELKLYPKVVAKLKVKIEKD